MESPRFTSDRGAAPVNQLSVSRQQLRCRALDRDLPVTDHLQQFPLVLLCSIGTYPCRFLRRAREGAIRATGRIVERTVGATHSSADATAARCRTGSTSWSGVAPPRSVVVWPLLERGVPESTVTPQFLHPRRVAETLGEAGPPRRHPQGMMCRLSRMSSVEFDGPEWREVRQRWLTRRDKRESERARRIRHGRRRRAPARDRGAEVAGPAVASRWARGDSGAAGRRHHEARRPDLRRGRPRRGFRRRVVVPEQRGSRALAGRSGGYRRTRVRHCALHLAARCGIHTDGARFLRGLSGMGYWHEYVTGYNASEIGEVLPRVHLVASLLKRWIAAPCNTRSASSSCPTTSTSTPSGSTGAPPPLAACSSTASCSKPSPPTHIRSTHSSPSNTALKQICRTCVRLRAAPRLSSATRPPWPCSARSPLAARSITSCSASSWPSCGRGRFARPWLPPVAAATDGTSRPADASGHPQGGMGHPAVLMSRSSRRGGQ